jgi:hypothetical protein
MRKHAGAGHARCTTAALGALVELRDDVRELQAAQCATGRSAAAGTVTLKEATAHADGYSAEMVRLWLNAGVVQGELIGGRWHVNVTSLMTYVAAKRSGVA